MSCPRCEGDDVRVPAFTWWGGAIGAHVLRRRVCAFCRFAFDARTGTANKRAIAVYVLASNGIFAAICSVLELVATSR